MNMTHSIQRLREVIRRQHKALSTETSYAYWLRRYIAAVTRMAPTLSSRQKLEQFLTDLACKNDVSASSQNQAFNAILYFYKEVLAQPIQGVEALRAKRPAHLRHAPTIPEIQRLLQTIRNEAGYPTRLIACLLYGCGLRVAEPLNLRIKDVDLNHGRLCIRDAKGGQDRVVALPDSLCPELIQQMNFARVFWLRDNQNATPVMLPHLLATKYPEYQFSWAWAWLFPAQRTCRHPRTQLIVRYRMHEQHVQRAVKIARQKLGVSVLPHELRHGYATHCMERGVTPRAIQLAMGHKSIETTMGYLHAESLSVPSPLDQFVELNPTLTGLPWLPPADKLPHVLVPTKNQPEHFARPILSARPPLNSSAHPIPSV